MNWTSSWMLHTAIVGESQASPCCFYILQSKAVVWERAAADFRWHWRIVHKLKSVMLLPLLLAALKHNTLRSPLSTQTSISWLCKKYIFKCSSGCASYSLSPDVKILWGKKALSASFLASNLAQVFLLLPPPSPRVKSHRTSNCHRSLCTDRREGTKLELPT